MLQGGNFVVRRTALEEIGGYNPKFSFYGEDTDLARRLNSVGAVKFTFRLPALSSGRRLIEEGMLQDRAALLDELRLGDVHAPAVHRRMDRRPALTLRAPVAGSAPGPAPCPAPCPAGAPQRDQALA